MRILVTRPRPDAEQLAAQLHERGHSTIIEPLIDIVVPDGPPLNLTDIQALLFTSANGARAAAHRTQERNLPVLAVGPATAKAAREFGFLNVGESPGEGVEGLAQFVRSTLASSNGELLHPTGTVSAGDLKASLEPFGFKVRRETIYEARAVETVSGALAAELGAGSITAAMFFSPRTAHLFATLIGSTELAPACRGIVALSLSSAVANALAPLAFRRSLIAATPTQEAMLDLTGRV
jgi:uroporphyrinogen-III synthase